MTGLSPLEVRQYRRYAIWKVDTKGEFATAAVHLFAKHSFIVSAANSRTEAWTASVIQTHKPAMSEEQDHGETESLVSETSFAFFYFLLSHLLLPLVDATSRNEACVHAIPSVNSPLMNPHKLTIEICATDCYWARLNPPRASFSTWYALARAPQTPQFFYAPNYVSFAFRLGITLSICYL